MSNTYYNVTTVFQPGDLIDAALVNAEYAGAEAGFSCLPPTSVGVGFASTVVVSDATSATHAMTWGQQATYGQDVNANSHHISGLVSATSNSEPLTYGQFKTWDTSVNAAGHQISNLVDPTSAQQAATKSYADTLSYTGGVSPSAIQITALSPGSATYGQDIMVSGNGFSVVGAYSTSKELFSFSNFV